MPRDRSLQHQVIATTHEVGGAGRSDQEQQGQIDGAWLGFTFSSFSLQNFRVIRSIPQGELLLMRTY